MRCMNISKKHINLPFRIMMGMLHGRHQQQQREHELHPPGLPPPPPPPRFYGDKIPNGVDVGEGDAKAAMVNGGGRVTLSR